MSLGFGIHNQMQPLPVFFLEEQVAPGQFERTNKPLDFTESRHLVLGYDLKFGTDWRIKAETYYQWLSDVPVESTPSSFALLNAGADFVFPQVGSLVAGKEFKIGKDRRNALTFDMKLTNAGGRFYTPINLELSQQFGTEILREELAFSEQFDPYFRLDVKVGIQMNSKKRKFSQQFFLDFQNVTNNENVFTRRYNPQTNEVNTVLQSGFFPDILYRVQF